MLYPQMQIFNTQLLPAQMMQKILVLKLLDACRDRRSWVAVIDSLEVLKDELTKKKNDNGFHCFLTIGSDKASKTKPKDPQHEILILNFSECGPSGVCFRTIGCDLK